MIFVTEICFHSPLVAWSKDNDVDADVHSMQEWKKLISRMEAVVTHEPFTSNGEDLNLNWTTDNQETNASQRCSPVWQSFVVIWQKKTSRKGVSLWINFYLFVQLFFLWALQTFCLCIFVLISLAGFFSFFFFFDTNCKFNFSYPSSHHPLSTSVFSGLARARWIKRREIFAPFIWHTNLQRGSNGLN